MKRSFEEYDMAVGEALTAHPEWRRGQTYFNTLLTYNPGLAEAVRTTPNDPFYRDERVPQFLAFIFDNWGH